MMMSKTLFVLSFSNSKLILVEMRKKIKKRLIAAK